MPESTQHKLLKGKRLNKLIQLVVKLVKCQLISALKHKRQVRSKHHTLLT